MIGTLIPVAILTGSHVAAYLGREAGHYALGEVEKSAFGEIKKRAVTKLTAVWRDTYGDTSAQFRPELQITLRMAYLRALQQVSRQCVARNTRIFNDISRWDEAVQAAASFEIAEMRKNGYTPKNSSMQQRLPAILQPIGADAETDALRNALLGELAQELACDQAEGAANISVFNEALRTKLMREPSHASNPRCPDELWKMLCEEWLDWITREFEAAIAKNDAARYAFTMQVMCKIGAREDSFSLEDVERAITASQADLLQALGQYDKRSSERDEQILKRLDQLYGEQRQLKAAFFETRGAELQAIGNVIQKPLIERAAREERAKPKLEHISLSLQEESILRVYLDWIATTFQYLPSSPRLHGVPVQLLLDKVYISVRGYPGSISELQQDKGKGSAKLPASFRHRDRVRSFSSDPESSEDLARAFRDIPSLVVLGDPGSGKTTLSRWLALNFARAMRFATTGEVLVPSRSVEIGSSGSDHMVSLGSIRLPIFVQISDLAKEMRKHPEGTPIAKLLTFGYKRPRYPDGHRLSGVEIEHQLLKRLFMRYLRGRQALVLFDGLDEVTNAKERQHVVDAIHEFMDDFPVGIERNRVLVTSRLVGYEECALRNPVRRFTVESMNAPAIREFSNAWHAGCAACSNQIAPAMVEQSAKVASDRFLKQIFAPGSGSLQQIASNPLMLSLLCALNAERGEELPDSRSELYTALVNRELDEAWAGRKPERAALREQLKSILGHLAEHLHRTTTDGLISRDDLEGEISKIAARYPEFVASAGSMHEVTTAIIEGAGILVERGLHQYAFNHRTTQEYLAAVALIENADTISTNVWDRCKDTRWFEVILFGLGIVAPFEKGERLKAICESLLKREEESKELLPFICLLLASAMAQVASFPVGVADAVLRRLFLRYAEFSVEDRQVTYCHLTEEIFAGEAASQVSSARRSLAISLLHEYAASELLEHRQAAAKITVAGRVDDHVLLELLAKGALSDDSRGGWRVRRSLVTTLSDSLATLPPLTASLGRSEDEIVQSLDPEAVAVLRDPGKVVGARYWNSEVSVAPLRARLTTHLFPLRQKLLEDPEAVEFLRSSPAWVRVAIALQGGLCLLGLEQLEKKQIQSRLAIEWGSREENRTTAVFLDNELEPKLEWLRSVPLSFDPSLIWRGSPLSSWLADRLAERSSDRMLGEQLLELWNNPEGELAERLIHEFEWLWGYEGSNIEVQTVDGSRALMADVALALAMLRLLPEPSLWMESLPDVYEAFRRECQWLEVYLGEPAFRSTLILEKSFAEIGSPLNLPVRSGTRTSSTEKAVQIAFPAELWPDPGPMKGLALVLSLMFDRAAMTEKDRIELESASLREWLEALYHLGRLRDPFWMKDDTDWIFPCLDVDRYQDGYLFVLLEGVRRIPEPFDLLRSHALGLLGGIVEEKTSLLPIAMRLAQKWETASSFFRDALHSWLLPNPPESDKEWTDARKSYKTISSEIRSPLLYFWVLRLVKPSDAVARRQWLSGLYETSCQIEDPVARLGAELQIFANCDVDETVPQLERMERVAATLENSELRPRWDAVLKRILPLAVRTMWSAAPDPEIATGPFAINGMNLLLDARPMRALSGLYQHNEERPYWLALYWSHVLSQQNDDPVYSCAVVLDTLGRVLSADLDDLLHSFVLLDTWIAIPFAREWPVMVTPHSNHRRRDLVLGALMVASRIPPRYQMIAEWFIKRIHPYLKRLDADHLPLAVAVCCKLKETNRAATVERLCPESQGDISLAVAIAWKNASNIRDPYLRWRTQWFLNSIGYRRKDTSLMIEAIGEIADPGERFVCLVLLQTEERTDLDLRNRNGHSLIHGISEEQKKVLRRLADASADASEPVQNAASQVQVRSRFNAAARAWLEPQILNQSSYEQRFGACIADFQLRVLEINASDLKTMSVLFWQQVAGGRSLDDVIGLSDPVTGVQFVRLEGTGVEILRRVLPPSLAPKSRCPKCLQFVLGATPESLPYLHSLSSSRNDVIGDWAALMLAETAVWTPEIISRARKLLRSNDSILRNRAMIALARGGDFRSSVDTAETLSAAKLGARAVEEMVSTLAQTTGFDPSVNMTMIFSLDRVIFDSEEQLRLWFDQSDGNTPQDERARELLGNISRGSAAVCRFIGSNLRATSPRVQRKLIRSIICLWERKNFCQDKTVWAPIREALLKIGQSDDFETAVSAVEALGYLGVAEHGMALVEIARSKPDRRSIVLRCLGIAAEGGTILEEEEKRFLDEQLDTDDRAVTVSAIEASLRAGRVLPYLEARQLLPDWLLDGLIAHVDGYFVGSDFVRKVRVASAWLEEVTHKEHGDRAKVTETTLGRLFHTISHQITEQSFNDRRRYPAHLRLCNSMAIAAGAAERMPETVKKLLEEMGEPFRRLLQSVILKNASYVARTAAMVLLSIESRFSIGFARALSASLGDLSILQATALQCVDRMDGIESGGLGRLEKLLVDDDVLTAFTAARIVHRMAASSNLASEVRVEFEARMNAALQTAMEHHAKAPQPVFSVESTLEDWTYRWSFLGWLRNAQEDALLAVRFPGQPASRFGTRDSSERIDLEVSGTKMKLPKEITLTFGACPSASKHPAMNQVGWLSTKRGESVPAEIMNSLEKIQKSHRALGISYAKLLHLAVESRTRSDPTQIG